MSHLSAGWDTMMYLGKKQMENINTEITGTFFSSFLPSLLPSNNSSDNKGGEERKKERNCSDLIRHSIPSIEHRTSKLWKEGSKEAKKGRREGMETQRGYTTVPYRSALPSHPSRPNGISCLTNSHKNVLNYPNPST